MGSARLSTRATILKTTPEILLEHLPQEDLDSISFRALENTEEINHRVKQLDDIFQFDISIKDWK